VVAPGTKQQPVAALGDMTSNSGPNRQTRQDRLGREPEGSVLCSRLTALNTVDSASDAAASSV
jgi:hypothetical protein